ncbi:MAG TPA: class I SAM-dependent methyltransferase [bacterium]|nr:class I SAM-dependent methyltransferase [bacterium]
MKVFDEYYQEYDRWYEKNNFLYLSEAAAVEMAMPKKGRGIEIGVGTGRFAMQLGIKEGCDISKNMLKIAASRGIRTRADAAEKLSYKNESFDFAVFIVTLCFVKNPLKALKEAYRVLKPGASVITAVIEKNSRLGRKYRKKKSVFYKNAVFFSVSELRTLIKNAGFEVTSMYQTLYRGRDKIQDVQKPLPGSGLGSFVVISAKKQEAVQ